MLAPLAALAVLLVSSATSNASGELHISLTATPVSPVAGTDFTVTANVSNSAPDVHTYLANVQLPPGISFVSSGSCTQDSGDPTFLNCPGGFIANNGSGSFSFVAHAAADAAGPATITPSVGSTDPLTNGSGDGLSVQIQGADLTPTITAPTGDHIAGDTATFDYAVTVQDLGTQDDTGGYSLTGSLPTGVQYVSSTSASGATCSGAAGGFTCTNASIVAGHTDNITLTAKALASAPPGTPATTVDVSSNGIGDPDTSNNHATTAPNNISIITRADLVPGVSAPAGSYTAGDTTGFNYTVTVTNTGPSNNTGGYTANGTLPDGVSFDSGSGPDANHTCSGSGTSFTCSTTAGLTSGSQDSYTVHVLVAASACPGGANLCDGTADASLSVAPNAGATTDPNTDDTAHTNPDVSIIARADLQPTLTVDSGDHIAGDTGFNYDLKVKNFGLSNNRGGFTANVSLPTGITFDSGPVGCSATATGFSCADSSDLSAGSTREFANIHVLAASSTCPGNPDAAGPPAHPACDGVATATASVPQQANTTIDPSTGDDSSVGASIITQADLEADSMTPTGSTSLYANPNPSQNATTFDLKLVNHGLSDARHVTVSLPDHPSGTTETYFKIDGVCRTDVAACTSPGDFTTNIDIGKVNGGATVHVIIKAHANANLGHAAPTPPRTSGRFTVTSTATVASATTDPGHFPNVKANGLSPNVTIDTVASPPQKAFAVPGTNNVILTWSAPASNGGQTIGGQPGPTNGTGYRIDITPPSGAPAVPSPTVLVSAPHNNLCSNFQGNDCYRLQISNLKNDLGNYQFNVIALNAVGDSDPGVAKATPSLSAQNTILQVNTSSTLTTCKSATATSPVCVVYTVPSGAGGVFGAQGNLAASLLGPNVCAGPCTGFGSQILASLTGYNVPTQPLQETVTFDASLFKNFSPKTPVCANNSVSTTCYPNNIPFYAEMSYALGLSPDPGGELLNKHFCVNPVSQGGAGNARYARPNPHLDRLQPPPTNYLGYADTAGSACLVKTNILGSKPDQSANGDVQLQINLTSDSDQSLGRK
jgi:hypothetical protein